MLEQLIEIFPAFIIFTALGVPVIIYQARKIDNKEKKIEELYGKLELLQEKRGDDIQQIGEKYLISANDLLNSQKDGVHLISSLQSSIERIARYIEKK